MKNYDFRLDVPGSRKVTITIEQDDSPCNPRKDFDQIGTMVCWHRNYLLGDEQPRVDSSEWARELAELSDERIVRFAQTATDEEVEQRVWKTLEQHYVILPLFLYDHSVQHISTESFVGRAQHAQWDSGRVGYIYVSKETAVANWGKKLFTQAVREQALKCLKAEVEEYDQYMSGDVYQYTVSRKGEELDSCAGFYGYKYAQQQAEEAARAVLEDLPLKEVVGEVK